MRSTQKKIALENETHQIAPKHCKLQPILEPGNHESVHNMLRVFVHFVLPYVIQMLQNHHTFIIRLVVKCRTVQLPKKIFHHACQKFCGGAVFLVGAVSCDGVCLLPTMTTGCSPGRT
jgi:hypothetical protein